MCASHNRTLLRLTEHLVQPDRRAYARRDEVTERLTGSDRRELIEPRLEQGLGAPRNVEGVEVARHMMEHARRLGLETPISSTFVALSDGRISPDGAIEALMARRVGKE